MKHYSIEGLRRANSQYYSSAHTIIVLRHYCNNKYITNINNDGVSSYFRVRKGRLHCVVLGSGKGFYLDFTRATLSVPRESRLTAILFGTKTAAGCEGGRARLVGRFRSILRRHLRSDSARKPQVGERVCCGKAPPPPLQEKVLWK